MNPRDLSALSGEANFARAPELVLNQVRLEGKKGVFQYRNVKKGLVAHPTKPERNVYETTDIGDTVDVSFLVIRRKMVEKMTGNPGELSARPAYTNEHNHKHETMLLSFDGGSIVGTAETLRAKYDLLRTQQIVYCLYKGELVRLTVKGASLGSKGKTKDTMSFYGYLSSFENNPKARDGSRDHFYDYVTTLKVIEETGDLGSYYTMNFIRGKAHSDKEMEAVGEAMGTVADFTARSDAFYAKRIADIGAAGATRTVPTAQISTVAYPEEEDTGEIPF